MLKMKAVIAISFLLISAFGISQTEGERLLIQAETNTKKLAELETQFQTEFEENYARALKLAQQNGWDLRIEFPDGGVWELMGVTDDGQPLYHATDNEGAGITARTNTLYPGGSLGLTLTGVGMTLGLWEIDATRDSHELFEGRVTQVDADVISSHATHVAGTIIGSDAFQSGTAKGMAYDAQIRAFNSTNDEAEVASEAATGNLLSSHSYGIPGTSVPTYYLGKYDSNARNFDEVMYNAPYYLGVFSAGNDRNDGINATGYDLLTDMSCNKNGMTIAAVNEVLNYTGPGSVTMSSFSSWGPTDDGRIKPDISAKGVSLYSSDSGNDSDYGYKSGTSMATPSTSGTLLLLQQHYNNLNGSFMRASTLRGLACHTADEAGNNDGPDYEFGWGLLNAERAADVITDNGGRTIISEITLTQGQTYSINVTASGLEDLMASITWTDPEGVVGPNVVDDQTPILINDLDIRVTQGASTFYPWILDVNNPSFGATTGDNLVDNIEKVEVNNPSGVYTITITHKGTLSSSQVFSLIVTGLIDTDCNGVLGGTAYFDNCGTCVGGNTGLTACIQDCNGDWGGTAYLDACNICVGGNTGLTDCVPDCNGDLGGTAYIDNCGTCVEGNTGLTPCLTCNATVSTYPNTKNFDSGWGNFVQLTDDDFDWTRQTGGTVSNGTGPTTGYNATSHYLYMEASSPNYPTKEARLMSSCYDLTSLTNPVVAFSYHMNGTSIGTLDLKVSTDDGNTWGSPIWTKSGQQDPDWLRDTTSLSAYTGQTIRFLFDGVTSTSWSGDIAIDMFTVMEAPGVPDCNGDIGGTAYLDNCNTCVEGNTGLLPCTQDCNGDWGGTAYLDNCTTCVEGNTGLLPCTQDCNSDWGGTAYLDNCNTCVEGNTGLLPCTQDCNGDWGGTAYLDNCNTCVEGNTGLLPCTQDCNGDWGGTAYLDNCNTCVEGNTGLLPCTQDCNGDWGGTAYLDNCNTCVEGNTGLIPCAQDCNGDWGGTAYLDNCNTCVEGNTGLLPCTQDCNGDWGGTAYLDNCNTCVEGNTGLLPCTQDCNGDWGGTAYLDNCNTCVEGNTGLLPCTQDCNGDWGGTAFIDSCQVCAGGNTGVTAIVYVDSCNVGLTLLDLSHIVIYPNPTQGVFTISAENIPSDNYNLAIYSIDGKVLFRNPTWTMEPLTVDFSKHEAGVYFIQISGKEHRFTKKIVLNR